MKSKKLKLGIIGGGPNSWIGHVHRISSRFDDKYEIVAGVFSRDSKQSTSFGKSIGVSEDCLLYTSPSPRDRTRSRMPSSA